MRSNSSPVSPDVVRKVAALARLSVPDEDLPVWAEQLARIVSYIDQLNELPEEQITAAEVSGTPLRVDEPAAGGGKEALESNARLLHGHGVVPRVVGGG
jgi:aspartyl/glutamyl-tRNA(Asn/Gln) amidotransferase C subunit